MIEHGAFVGASGKTLDFKIECDSLTSDDLLAIARIAVPKLAPFDEVLGVPRGGQRLVPAFAPWASPRGKTLVVDDVWTTGHSMNKFVNENGIHDWHGFVIFARGPLPPNVTAMFHLSKEFTIINQKEIDGWNDFPDEGHGIPPKPAPRSIVARMKCEAILPGIDAESVSLVPVYSDDPAHPNHQWSKWTPAGSLVLTISNPDARGAFTVGGEYEVFVTQVLPR